MSLQLVLFLLLRNPQVQTLVSKFTAAFLSQKTGAEVTIGKINIGLTGNLFIKELKVDDQKGREMISINNLEFTPDVFLIKEREIRVKSFDLEGVTIALRKYSGDDNTNLKKLFQQFSAKNPDTLQQKNVARPWKIFCNNLKVRNTHFLYENQQKKESRRAIDYNDIELLDMDILASDVEIDMDTIRANFRNVAFIEKSGFELKEFSGRVTSSPIGMTVDQMKIKANNSHLDMDLRFTYNNLSAFSDFINQVKFYGVFRNSELEMSDIGYFSETMFSMTDLIKFRGIVSGKVSNIRGKNLEIEYGDATKFLGSIIMNGLPNITETFIHANIHELTTRATDVKSFALPANASNISVPDLLVKMGTVNIKGKFTGFYNDFVSKAEFKSKLGNLETDIVLKTIKEDQSLTYRGKLIANNLDVGTLFSVNPQLGKTNFTLEVDGKGIDAKSLDVTAKGIVESVNFMGYNYENISLDGNYRDMIFKGHTNIKDENLDFVFDGLIHFSEAKPRFDFHSRINYANLFDLNISTRDTVSEISTIMNFDFTASSIDDIRGTISFDSTKYNEGMESYFLSQILFSATHADNGLNGLSINSDFIDAHFKGNYTLSDIVPSIKKYLWNYSPVMAEQISKKQPGHQNQFIDFNIGLKNTTAISKLFFPELTIAPNSIVSGVFNFPENKVQIEGNADWIKYSTIKIQDWKLLTDSDSQQFDLTMDFDKILLGNINQSDTIGVGVDSLQIHTGLRNDTIIIGITWNDLNNLQRNKGDIKGYLQILGKDQFAAGFTKVDMLFDSASWTVKPDNKIIAGKDGLFFNDLNFTSDSSMFTISGGISKQPADSLWLLFKELDISHLDQFIRSGQVDVNGILNGNITLVNLLTNPNFLANISLNDLFFNGEDLGILNLSTIWEDAESRLGVNLDIFRKGNLGISEVLKIDGDYYPSGDNQNFDLRVTLSNLGTHIFNPFIQEYVSIDNSSLASGNIELTGNYLKPVAKGKINLMRTQLLVKYLNTLYSAAGSIDIGKNFINVNNLELYDTKRRSAICSGKINHNYFRDFSLDIRVEQENFNALNTTSRDNELFYGTAVASGNVDINGPFDDILMEVKVKTEEGTRIIIPISSSLSVSENDFIIFLNNADTVTDEEPTYNLKLKGFSMNMELDVTPDANIELYLPYNMGNIKGNGSGDIGIGINPSGDFTINGDYVISDGDFYFNFENLFGREFKIKEGSKIGWTGDPYDASVNIMATYTVKTTLAGLRLQTDSSSIRNTRVEVNCNINLKNALFNPDIKFSIDFANVAEDTKQIIYAALDTSDQSAMSQQILSLLVIGSFSYATAGPNISATGFKVLSNQLSEWLSRISKDFDIGINYQPGTELTEEELEVALRTQLFNDRLSIDGNFGVRGTSEDQNTSNVVGDINVEYKITDDGGFRVKAFNRTNDISFLEDNAPYTQGVGIFYRKEFETFRDLFKRDKNKKRKNEKHKRNKQAVKNEGLSEVEGD